MLDAGQSKGRSRGNRTKGRLIHTAFRVKTRHLSHQRQSSVMQPESLLGVGSQEAQVRIQVVIRRSILLPKFARALFRQDGKAIFEAFRKVLRKGSPGVWQAEGNTRDRAFAVHRHERRRHTEAHQGASRKAGLSAIRAKNIAAGG